VARTGVLTTLMTGVLVLALAGTVSAASSGGWNNLGPAGAGNPDYGAIEGGVYVLEVSGSRLYVGGDFNNAGDVAAADRIAVWTGSKWSAACATTLTGDGPSGAVYSIAVDTVTGKVYAGGSFSNAGGDAAADGLAVCSGGAWHSVGGVSFSSNITALEVVGRDLYIAGGFLNGAGLPTADYVVAYHLDGGGYFAITDTNADFINGPNDIEADGAGGAYFGGNFLDADHIQEADYVVHYDGSGTWSALGSGPGPAYGAIQSSPGQVRGLAVAGNGDLYAVGQFTNVVGTGGVGDKIAKWNGSSWEGVGSSSFFGEADAINLLDVVVDGPRVIVVGNFSNAGGLTKVDGVAAFKNGSWTNVGTNANGTDGPLTGPNPILKDVAIVGSRLYIGGLDQDIGGGLLNDSVAFFRLRQPDALIRTSGSFIGNNVYNGTGSNQTKSLSANQGATVTFTIRVTNDGFATDDFTVKGTGSQSGFTAIYKRGATNITSQVVAGTYAINGLAPGASVDITLSVKVGSGVANNVTKSFLVTATSTGGGSAKDAVKAKVTST
jgi:hypothetical protein